jgi:hypothetical protein
LRRSDVGLRTLTALDAIHTQLLREIVKVY